MSHPAPSPSPPPHPPPTLSPPRLPSISSTRPSSRPRSPPLLPSAPHHRRPLAVLLLGQTGAGKSHLSAPLHAALRPPAAHLVADAHKAYHPAYAGPGSKGAAAAAAAEARRWLAQACERAAAADVRADALVEAACRHPADSAGLARGFARAGCGVRAVVLAVPPAASRAGVAARFVRCEVAGPGMPVRLTPRAVHDESLAGLARVATWLDGEEGRAVVERVAVVRRGGLVAYEGAGGGVGAALEREWRRGLTPEEGELVARELQAMEAVEGGAAVAEQVAEIREMLLGDGEGGRTGGADEEGFPELVPLDVGRFVGEGLL